MNLYKDMRSGRQTNCRTGWQFHEAVPRRPASDPLPGFLDREKSSTDDATIARHVLDGAKTTLSGQV
jgi:hypothetical protein